MSRLRVLARYFLARHRRFKGRSDLERWQQRHLGHVLKRAPGRYPFYAALPGPLDSLTDLPVMDKPDVIAHFADLNVRGVDLAYCLAAARAAEVGRDFSTSLGGLSVGLSSGTSGQQTAFLTSAAERDRWAGEVLARALPRGLLAGARITLVLRAGGPLYESVGSRRVSFTFVDLALDPAQLVAQVLASRPTVLVAPPSVLLMLVRSGASGLGADLDRVFSAAEVLEPQDALEIEGGLGLRVDQVYQAAEGFLGMSCSRGTLHLAEDLLIVEREVVGEDGRFVPVVTDLFRTSQAVLRRRLGDVLVPGSCDCGDPRLAIAEIVGRSDDYLVLPRIAADSNTDDDATDHAPFFPDFVRAAILSVPGVRDFRVVQGSDVTTLAVEPPDLFGRARDALAAALTRAGLVPPEIAPAPFEPHDPLRKLRRVRRLP